MTAPQLATAFYEIDQIVNQATDFNLEPYYYPKSTRSNKTRTVFILPGFATVANAAFSHIPAVLTNTTATAHYLALAKEYFLHG